MPALSETFTGCDPECPGLQTFLCAHVTGFFWGVVLSVEVEEGDARKLLRLWCCFLGNNGKTRLAPPRAVGHFGGVGAGVGVGVGAGAGAD